MPKTVIGRSVSTLLGNRLERWLTAIVGTLCLMLWIASPAFRTLSNATGLIESYSVQAIMAMGLLVVLIAGGIDISFAAIASVAQYGAALLATRYHLPAAIVIPAGLAIGTCLGCVNATLIHYARVTSIIITIATMNTYFALLMYFTGGTSIYDLPEWWSERIVFLSIHTAAGDLARITLPIIVAGASVVLTWVLLDRTRAGRQLYAVGGNPEAARRVGISLAKIAYTAYGFLGFMSALAGLVQANRVGESVPNALYGNELSVLSAVVLGGASLLGGVGTVRGTLLGVLLLALVQNGLNLLGISSYCFDIIMGVIVLVSMTLTTLSGRRQLRARPLESSAHA